MRGKANTISAKKIKNRKFSFFFENFHFFLKKTKITKLNT